MMQLQPQLKIKLNLVLKRNQKKFRNAVLKELAFPIS